MMWTSSKSSLAVLMLWVLQSTFLLQHHAVDSFLIPVIKPPSKVLCNKAVACRKKQLRFRKKKKQILFLKKKKKQQKKKALSAATGAAVTAVGVAGAAAAAATAVPIATAAAVVALSNVEASEIYTPEVNSLNGQSILITGGTTGLGLETAKRLAIGSPDNLIITARTSEKGQDAVDKIYKYLSVEGVESDTISISYKVLNLDDVQGIQNSVNGWFEDESSPFPDQLDCIINNAGVMAIPKLELTDDGIERQMASNHVGHFVLTKMLSSKLSKRAKVINVSSSAHEAAKPNGMDFDYCWEGSPNYSPWKSYGQSKLANILFSQELQRRSDEAGYEWDVACLHPGVITSTDLFVRQPLGPENFQRFQELQDIVQDRIPTSVKDGLDTLSTKIGDLGLIKTIEQGATTSVWLASGAYQKKSIDDDEDGDDEDSNKVRTNAQYYEDCKPKSLDEFAMNGDAAQRLWKESEERAGITFDLAQSAEVDEKQEVDNDVKDSAVEESSDENGGLDAEEEPEEKDDEDSANIEDDSQEED